MKVALDAVSAGDAVDLRGRDVDPGRLLAAVEDSDDDFVDCPPPGPLHEYAGHVRPGMSVPVRAAVAAAARSLGAGSPVDEKLATVRAELVQMPEPSVDLAAQRRRVAETRQREEGLSERVARLAGRVETLRERDADPAAAEQRLAEATRELADAETERVAAEQRLDRARREAAASRDVRERRLELADKRANLRRVAREHLASEHYDTFASAVRAVPGSGAPGSGPGEYDGDGVTAALAVARMGEMAAPVVLECGRFPSVKAAHACLGTPVLRV
jgi:hypothetical protein